MLNCGYEALKISIKLKTRFILKDTVYHHVSY